MTMRLTIRIFTLFIALFWAWTTGLEAAESSTAPLAPEYRVGNSDELNFRFLYVPEFNTVATVRSDGRVSLPLIGEFQVDGLTLTELTAKVEQLMSAHLRRPQVTVNVQGAASQRIFVGGEVTRPGVQPLLGPLTVLQAVTVAEGLKDTAQPRQTIILRRGPAGSRTVLTVDLDSLMNGQDLSQDMPLQASDVVIVPRSGIADVNRWIDHYIRRVLPFSLGAGISYSVNGIVQ
jgi:protein involved in polysaccharide export with SLBB domain